MQPLRLTDTNSASDSKGSVWGIQGNLFWVVLVAALLSLLILLALFSLLEVPLLAAMIGASVPLALAIGYVVFKQSRPPGYDLDLFDYWVNGPGFGPPPVLNCDD